MSAVSPAAAVVTSAAMSGMPQEPTAWAPRRRSPTRSRRWRSRSCRPARRRRSSARVVGVVEGDDLQVAPVDAAEAVDVVGEGDGRLLRALGQARRHPADAGDVGDRDGVGRHARRRGAAVAAGRRLVAVGAARSGAAAGCRAGRCAPGADPVATAGWPVGPGGPARAAVPPRPGPPGAELQGAGCGRRGDVDGSTMSSTCAVVVEVGLEPAAAVVVVGRASAPAPRPREPGRPCRCRRPSPRSRVPSAPWAREACVPVSLDPHAEAERATRRWPAPPPLVEGGGRAEVTEALPLSSSSVVAASRRV